MPDSRAVSVFETSNVEWSQEAVLKPSHRPTTNDWFGYLEAIDDDTIVVGVPYEDGIYRGVCAAHSSGGSSIEQSGAIFVFVRNGSIWQE